MGVETWYHVRFDDQGVHRAAQPPGREPWSDSLAWDAIVRVCLEMEGCLGSDSIYLFSRHRPESYAIPYEAAGSAELIGELVRRGLLDGRLAIEAASSEGRFCWPPE
ncbi:MAG: hypothetical protein IT317_02400 [Anaerolineales bacterium]|nr:hypothetical protein [Anaerolineales bacterium]